MYFYLNNKNDINNKNEKFKKNINIYLISALKNNKKKKKR